MACDESFQDPEPPLWPYLKLFLLILFQPLWICCSSTILGSFPFGGFSIDFFLAFSILFSDISSVQFSCSVSHVRLFATPWTAAHQASLSITNSRSLLKPMSTESVMPSNHLILCHPLLLLPSIFPSIRVFSNDSVLCIRWPKYWSFRFSNSASNEYSGLISFRIDWLDLLAVQGTVKSLLQLHSSKASSALSFHVVQLSHPYMITGNTIALTTQTFVGKVMSLLMSLPFNILSRLVIAFLLRSKCLFNFMAAVTICSDFGAQESSLSLFLHLFAMEWWHLMPWS